MKTADGVEIVVGMTLYTWSRLDGAKLNAFELKDDHVLVGSGCFHYSTERAAKQARAAKLRKRAAEQST